MNERCEEIQALAPVVALGVASGDERAVVLDHIVSCEGCRSVVREMSELADRLLLAAPAREPSVGFETRVARAIGADGGTRARPRFVYLVAAAVVAGAIGSAAMWWGTGDERRLGRLYRETLATAEGEYFSATKLSAPSGTDAGVVFAYEGRPSWVFVVVREDGHWGSYEIEVTTESGQTVQLGDASFDPAHQGWGTDVVMPVHDLEEVRLLAPGAVELVARMGADD